jgi:hypothetical protein
MEDEMKGFSLLWSDISDWKCDWHRRQLAAYVYA